MWMDLSFPWQACFKEAWTSYCSGSLPIGAVVVDVQGRIVAQGRNRMHEQTAEGKVLSGHRLAHAEMNALLQASGHVVDLTTCILYTTTEPCPLCVGAIRMARLREVRYASRDGLAGSADLFEANAWMRRGKISVMGPESALLETILITMLAEWSLTRSLINEKTRVMYEMVATMVPFGALLGQQLFSSRQLHQWREEGRIASFVYDQLANMAEQAISSL
jgi:tRNA(adenine34) deaminase